MIKHSIDDHLARRLLFVNRMYLVYLFLAVTSILLFLLVFLIYSGLFTSINISVKPPPIKGGAYLYKFYQQHYRLAGEAYREVLKFPTKEHQCLGIYYDDPKKVKYDSINSLYFSACKKETKKSVKSTNYKRCCLFWSIFQIRQKFVA